LTRDVLLAIGHRHDRTLEAALQQIVHDDVAGVVIPIGGADNGDRVGIEQLVQVVDRQGCHPTAKRLGRRSVDADRRRKDASAFSASAGA
jgi:hypothetical protein